MDVLALMQKRGDVIVPVSVVSIVDVIILPVPAFVLDISMSFSISLSIVILVSAVYIKKPLDQPRSHSIPNRKSGAPLNGEFWTPVVKVTIRAHKLHKEHGKCLLGRKKQKNT